MGEDRVWVQALAEHLDRGRKQRAWGSGVLPSVPSKGGAYASARPGDEDLSSTHLAAKALGLDVPLILQQRADEVIE